MLTLTDNCATIVKSLTDQPNANGLRIAHDEATNAQFALSTATEPQPHDHVLEQNGATVYLEQGAADELQAMQLDAGLDGEGNLRFQLAPQQG